VIPTHTAQMVLFAQTMCIPAQVVQMWTLIILRNACIYMRPDL
jgi:chemotaxis methyl-accepting protein methylase